MSAKRLGLLLTLTIIATTVDWVVLSNNWVFPGYHYLGWTTVWLLVFFIMQKRWLDSIVTVAMISVIEDFLYLTYGSLIGARTFYPLYCHAWIPDVYGSWAELGCFPGPGLAGHALLLLYHFSSHYYICITERTPSDEAYY